MANIEGAIRIDDSRIPVATSLDGALLIGLANGKTTAVPTELLKDSAYLLAQQEGYTGTLTEWLDSLVGKSAYEIALETGFAGTIEEWLLSLKGIDGTVSFDELTPEQREHLKGDTGEKGDKGDAPVKGVDYFDGKNPVVLIGAITTVASNVQADATIEPDGVDAEGKPKFKLNLWLPKGEDGAGDMLKSVYDQTGKNTDVFGYVDNKVKTDVPVGAKFTDTTYNNATTAVSGLMSNTDKSKLDGVEAGANKYVHPAGTNPHGTTKSDVGLGNVDNVKQIPFSEKGSNNGVAELDSTGKVLSSQLPSYVDDVLEYATLADFPTTGETGKIYIAINTNLTYRWTGTAYTEISPSIALGETSATAYRGDRGKIAYDHSQTAHAPSNAQKNSDITKAEIEEKLTGAITTHTHDYVPTSRTIAGKALTANITLAKGDVGLGSVDNTSDANKPVSTAQQTALNAKMDSNKFQVVESLPASPAEEVFYFVKE